MTSLQPVAVLQLFITLNPLALSEILQLSYWGFLVLQLVWGVKQTLKSIQPGFGSWLLSLSPCVAFLSLIFLIYKIVLLKYYFHIIK